MAVSIKKPVGTKRISLSVSGFKIHKSLSKNISWNLIKYLSKSEDIINTSTAVVSMNTTEHIIIIKEIILEACCFSIAIIISNMAEKTKSISLKVIAAVKSAFTSII